MSAPFGDLDREMRLRARIDKLNDLIEDLKRDNERLRDLALERSEKQLQAMRVRNKKNMARLVDMRASRDRWRGMYRRDVDSFPGQGVSR